MTKQDRDMLEAMKDIVRMAAEGKRFHVIEGSKPPVETQGSKPPVE